MDIERHRWHPGQTIVVRETWKKRLWAARPVVVVEDTGDFVATWMPRGTVWRCPVTPPDRPKSPDRGERIARLLKLQDWELEERKWPFSTLCLMSSGDPFAVLVGWSETGERFPSWYVNIQEPFERGPDHLVTMDLVLYVLIDPDGTWRWKDEDELETLVRENAISEEEARDIRDAGVRAVERFASKGPPYDERWFDWTPDPGWPFPVLPS